MKAAYRITVRFIPLGSTDYTIVANIDEQWCRSHIPEINAIYAPANVELI